MAFVEQIRTFCRKTKYENELEKLSSSKSKKDKKRAETLTGMINDVETEENDNTTEIEKSDSKINRFLDMVKINDYKKPWSKLLECHKLVKAKDFVHSLKIKDIIKRNELLEKITTAIKEKKITKKDSVDYDETTCVIKSIKGLTFDEVKKVKVWKFDLKP
jgi:hypothetical protein